MKIIDAAVLDGLKEAAGASPRRRAHHTLHEELSDPIQRVVIALEPGTYVRPHRHVDRVWELFVLAEGMLAVLGFDDDGRVTDRVELRAGGPRMVELPGGTWHSIVALEPGTLALEVKPGPYRPATDKDFAAWAPAEGDAAAPAMVAWLERARAGEGF